MNGFDIWNAIVGSGFLVGFLSIWLNWKNSKSKTNIDWYDRAIKEIERLEKRLESADNELDELKGELDKLEIKLLNEKEKNNRLMEENKFLTSKVDELQVIIKEIRFELDALIKRREEHDEQ